MGKEKVAYYYDSEWDKLRIGGESVFPCRAFFKSHCLLCAEDVGSCYYGPNHPMKPHRITMTHHLVMAYGIHKKLEVRFFC